MEYQFWGRHLVQPDVSIEDTTKRYQNSFDLGCWSDYSQRRENKNDNKKAIKVAEEVPVELCRRCPLEMQWQQMDQFGL